MHTYKIEYFDNEGNIKLESVEAPDVGPAFAKCQKLHPGLKMIRAIRAGQWKDGWGQTIWQPPMVQRDPAPDPKPARTPKPDEKDGVMFFYDEVVQPAT